MEDDLLEPSMAFTTAAAATADVRDFYDKVNSTRPLSSRRQLEDYLATKQLAKELECLDTWFESL